MNGKTSNRALSRLGHVLAVLRHRRGWSREELARASALSVKTVVRYEETGKTPSLQTLDAVLAALDCPLGDVLLPEKLGNPRSRPVAERELQAQVVDLHLRLDRVQQALIGETVREASRLARDLASPAEPDRTRFLAETRAMVEHLGDLRSALAIEPQRTYAVQLEDLDAAKRGSARRHAANDS